MSAEIATMHNNLVRMKSDIDNLIAYVRSIEERLGLAEEEIGKCHAKMDTLESKSTTKKKDKLPD